MIRFLRQIRQNLVEQKNIRTYILYAIGEILLVVIGILIALQVNNWNENRKDNTRAKQYLASLRTDLQEDLNMMRVGYDIAYADSLQLTSHLKRLNDSEIHPDTVKNILLYQFDYFIRAPRPFNRKTYTTLLSTGDIGLLNDEVAQRLVQLIKEQDVRTRLIEAVSDVYNPTIISYSQKYPLGHLPMSQSLTPGLYNDIDKIQMLKEFNLIALIKSLNNQRIMARQRGLLPLTEELIHIIDQTIPE